MSSTGLRGWVGALCAALWLAAWTAHAQESPHDAEAHAYFEAGRLAYGDGRFDEALTAFQRAYELSHRSQLLYNIGQCFDRMRHDADALAAFQQFLAAEPESPNAAEVRGRVAFLERALATSATTADTPPAAEPSTASAETTTPEAPTPSAPPPAASSDPGAAPWVLIGVGGALAIAGAVLVGLGFMDVSTVENAADGARYATVRDADQQATPLIASGFAGLGVGVVLAAIGVVLAVSGPSSGERAATLRLGPGSIVLQGSF